MLVQAKRHHNDPDLSVTLCEESHVMNKAKFEEEVGEEERYKTAIIVTDDVCMSSDKCDRPRRD